MVLIGFGIKTFLCKKFPSVLANDTIFMFRNLTKHSTEVLFEIWDQLENSTEKFLGLGIGL